MAHVCMQVFAPQLITNEDLSNGQPTQSTSNIALDIQDLQEPWSAYAQFSVFDLSDAMLAGNSTQVAKILFQLKVYRRTDNIGSFGRLAKQTSVKSYN